jgi:hypothetical protein
MVRHMWAWATASDPPGITNSCKRGSVALAARSQQPGDERGHARRLEQGVARNAQLAAQGPQIVLRLAQQGAGVQPVGGHAEGDQRPDGAVEFIHIAHGRDTLVGLADAPAVTQTGAAIDASAGGDRAESVAHAQCAAAMPTAGV